MIESLSPEQTSDVVYAFLKVGVPPEPVSKATGVDLDAVKGCLNHMHVERYGTDEIGGAMTHLIWVAYETALHEIEYGTPASKARFIQLVLARSVALAGKSSPETSDKIQAAIDEMRSHIAPVVQLSESIYPDQP